MQNEPPGYTGFTIAMTSAQRDDGTFDVSYPVIREVLADTPASRAGLVSSDVIVEVNGVDAGTVGSLYPILGQRYAMRIRRGIDEREIVLVSVPKPATWSTGTE